VQARLGEVAGEVERGLAARVTAVADGVVEVRAGSGGKGEDGTGAEGEPPRAAGVLKIM
jgi:hypothetical protein